jgi:alpha-N-arabinofuranosidase
MYLNNNPHDSFFVFYKKKCVKSIRWNPDAIVFNSWQHYGCPNYWMLHFFKDSSGATLHPTTIQASNYGQLVASAITWQNGKDKSTYLRIKVNHRLIALLPCFPRSRGKKRSECGWEIVLPQVVNFGSRAVDLNVSVAGLASGMRKSGSRRTVLTSSSPLDENSFRQPEKVGSLFNWIGHFEEEADYAAEG